ncbi:MAG: hypothetical protein WB523_18130 [Candidatus Sulfotelmatobacter sp.]
MKFSQLLAILLFIATYSLAQSTPASVYAESFRQGPTHIVEEKFEVKLTPQDATYRERIKDSSGNDRYALSITPQGPEGDTEITSWQVKLVDLHHPVYDNVLLSSQNASGPKDPLWRLVPSGFTQVPVTAKRIIKVDNFYVVLQIKAYHFTPPGSPYLDSMRVGVEFTNTDPRAAENPQK